MWVPTNRRVPSLISTFYDRIILPRPSPLLPLRFSSSDTMCTAGEYHPEASIDAPPASYPSFPPGRRYAPEVPVLGLSPHSAVSAQSPHGYDSAHFGYLEVPSQVDDTHPPALYDPQSATALQGLFDTSLMAQEYLGFPTHHSGIQQGASYSRSHSSASSPEMSEVSYGSSPWPGYRLFRTQSSPGYRVHESPLTDTARSASDFIDHALAQHHSDYHTSLGPQSSILPVAASSSFQPSLTPQRPSNDWRLPPSSPLPAISLSSRIPMTRPSPTATSAFGQFSVVDDMHGWPQFRLNQARKIGPRKPQMSCFFCRERKIGCTRPDVKAEDQSCNQCARRKRVCVYPTQSLRGQHTRRRTSPTNRVGPNEPTIPQVTPPTLL
ncbi:hypothetical protein C8R46DRAFT_310167 [Mycena filopes]|nr:hypothetical protein C8R46DRAFT_310167 [Mycena filopes]